MDNDRMLIAELAQIVARLEEMKHELEHRPAPDGKSPAPGSARARWLKRTGLSVVLPIAGAATWVLGRPMRSFVATAGAVTAVGVVSAGVILMPVERPLDDSAPERGPGPSASRTIESRAPVGSTPGSGSDPSTAHAGPHAGAPTGTASAAPSTAGSPSSAAPGSPRDEPLPVAVASTPPQVTTPLETAVPMVAPAPTSEPQTKSPGRPPTKPSNDGGRALSQQECSGCGDQHCIIYIDGYAVNLCEPPKR